MGRPLPLSLTGCRRGVPVANAQKHGVGGGLLYSEGAFSGVVMLGINSGCCILPSDFCASPTPGPGVLIAHLLKGPVPTPGRMVGPGMEVPEVREKLSSPCHGLQRSRVRPGFAGYSHGSVESPQGDYIHLERLDHRI